MNPIIVAAIIQVVLELLKNCPEERADRIKAHLNNPGPLMRIRFEGALRRRLNISPAEWRANAPTIMPAVYAEGQAVTLEDAQEFAEMAKSA